MAEDLTLRILREIRNDIADLRGEMRHELRSVGSRLLAIEERFVAGTIAEHRHDEEITTLKARLERIERRLDLADG